MTEFTHFCLFSGLGGISLGLNRGHARIGQAEAKLRCIGGIDSNPAAARDFTKLTGTQGTCLDLFDREDYGAFHGHEPPPEWREATVDDIRAAAGGEFPDIVATSPPCKGFSGLLNEKSSKSAKYQALNRLVLRGLVLTLEAFKDDPPSLILLENVPRIQTRGRYLLDQVQGLLMAYGYATAETTHDCGELGGLAQHRRRFLLVARHRAKVAPFLYEPPRRPFRTVGEVLEALPMPEDKRGGPMHMLPRLQWKTWVRLALIEAGKDWRSLQDLEVVDGHLKDIGIVPTEQWHGGVLGVTPWDRAGCTVTGRSGPTTGAYNVADPRAPRDLGSYEPYGVVRWDGRSHTVTGQAAPGSGPYSIQDPRLKGVRHNNVYRLARWDHPSPAVTGGTGPSSGGLTIADPRPGWSRRPGDDWSAGGHYGVVSPDDQVGAVPGKASHDRGAWSVAERRLPAPSDRPDPLPLIVSLDGTWHRPFTTLELAALQGFPVFEGDAGLELDGRSQSAWRERIGNAVPPPTAAAIGNVMADTLLRNHLDQSFALSSTPIWVRRIAMALSMDH